VPRKKLKVKHLISGMAPQKAHLGKNNNSQPFFPDFSDHFVKKQ
jgi:hypothetical protein